jgi:hypothetical protein
MSVATRGMRPIGLMDCLDRGRASGFRAAVSLHAHTHHSKEIMADLPAYIVRIPFVSKLFERELRAFMERDGQAVDFSKGWWHPPVSPRAVFESEVAQIENSLQLAPLVSITDHDDVTAGLELQARYNPHCAPVSFEWTAPYDEGFFHIGVHNLPPDSATEWFTRLADHTREGRCDRLPDLVAALADESDVLLVLNHPQWDLAGIGDAAHEAALARFIAQFRPYLHALELNGYRSWSENEATCALSAATGIPLISGGDRHGCAPNAMLNLTHGRSFSEFAAEVRAGVSEVLIMPEYCQHLSVRKLAAAAEVLRRYPEYPRGRQNWTDRVSCEWEGQVRPLSYHWPDGGPLWVRSAVCTFQVITGRLGLPIVNLALGRFEGAAGAQQAPGLTQRVSIADGLSQN